MQLRLDAALQAAGSSSGSDGERPATPQLRSPWAADPTAAAWANAASAAGGRAGQLPASAAELCRVGSLSEAMAAGSKTASADLLPEDDAVSAASSGSMATARQLSLSPGSEGGTLHSPDMVLGRSRSSSGRCAASDRDSRRGGVHGGGSGGVGLRSRFGMQAPPNTPSQPHGSSPQRRSRTPGALAAADAFGSDADGGGALAARLAHAAAEEQGRRDFQAGNPKAAASRVPAKGVLQCVLQEWCVD